MRHIYLTDVKAETNLIGRNCYVLDVYALTLVY